MSVTGSSLVATADAFEFFNSSHVNEIDNDTFHNYTTTMGPSVPATPDPRFRKLTPEEYRFIVKVFRLYLNPFLCAFGICTNVASLIVIRKDGINKSSNILLLALAIADLMFVACKADIPGGVILYYGPTAGVFSYEMFYFLFVFWAANYYLYTVAHLCSLTLPILITAERLIAIFVPLKFSIIVTPKRTITACTAVFVCFFMRCILTLFEYGVRQIGPNRYFVFRKPISFQDWYLDLIKVTNYITGFVYLGLVIAGTIIIGVKVAYVAQQRLKMSASAGANDKKRTTRTTKTLLSVCVLYCTTNLVIFIVEQLRGSEDTPYTALLYDINDEIAILNSSFNFFIYIFYNKKFRSYLSFRKNTTLKDQPKK